MTLLAVRFQTTRRVVNGVMAYIVDGELFKTTRRVVNTPSPENGLSNTFKTTRRVGGELTDVMLLALRFSSKPPVRW